MLSFGTIIQWVRLMFAAVGHICDPPWRTWEQVAATNYPFSTSQRCRLFLCHTTGVQLSQWVSLDEHTTTTLCAPLFTEGNNNNTYCLKACQSLDKTTYLGRFWCIVCLGRACRSLTIANAIGTLSTSSSPAMLPRAFLCLSSLWT